MSRLVESFATEAYELRLTDVVKTYGARGEQGEERQAVDGVSFAIAPGQALGLVGQSGSGKTTLARLVTGVERPTSGRIQFGDVRVDRLRRRQLREYWRDVQMVFQDPYAALNPAHTVGYVLARPLHKYLQLRGAQLRKNVHELLDIVGLTPVEQFAGKLPHQLSGGQRQRVVIAHALAPKPKLIIADEPISMLDVSLRAGILSLLDDLRTRTGISLLYITHDLLSARVATSEIIVLHHGRIVEQGQTTDLLQRPQQEYTKHLLAAIPDPFRNSSRGGK
jgi:peptide/nickel transport system ATP-binding protein